MNQRILLTLFSFAYLLSVVGAQEPELTNDLAFVSDESLGVLSISPTKILQIKELASDPLADISGKFGIKPSQVERIAFFHGSWQRSRVFRPHGHLRSAEPTD